MALVALLPFIGGILAGETLYFRDLARQFIPLRLFAVEGLRRGEIRFWNPYLHEGEPLSLPALAYPPDLLQALLPTESGISTTLALHVPFAALAFFALARGLGLGRGAAAGGAITYALGGFTLSTLNLYVYVQAIAWAPLIALGLRRAAEGATGVAPASVACAVAVSTTGLEIVAQAFALGLLIAAPGRNPRAWLRALSAIVLGAGLAAPIVAVVGGLVAGSARSLGFPVEVVLSHSVHPLTFAQTAVAGLYGDPADPVNHWWGVNFFPRGFPYFLSLYLGAAVLSLAIVGLREGSSLARGLAVLMTIGVVACLGRWAHLSALIEMLPALRAFRFPSKAFFTVHAAIALLTALGLDALAAGARRAWRLLGASALASGSALVGLSLVPLTLPGLARWFARGFFPAGYGDAERLDLLWRLLGDAARGGSLAFLTGLVAVCVLGSRVRPGWAIALVVGLVATDLLRAGAGLNRMVDPRLLRPSEEVLSLAKLLREEGGRIYSPDPDASPAYGRGRRAHATSHELWSFAVLVDTASPHTNMRLGLPSALSIDTTMLVPQERVTPAESAGPEGVAELVPKLRDAGVTHVLSLDPLEAKGLRWSTLLAPPRIAPLSLFVYEVVSPLPLRSLAAEVVVAPSRSQAYGLAKRPGFQEGGGVAVEGPAEPVVGARGRLLSLRERPGRLEAEVESDRPSVLLVRDAYASGWYATVGERPVAVLRANGRFCAVPLPSGRSRVSLRYSPPRMLEAVCVALASASIVAFQWRSAREPGLAAAS